MCESYLALGSPASTSQVLGLWACATMPGLCALWLHAGALPTKRHPGHSFFKAHYLCEPCSLYHVSLSFISHLVKSPAHYIANVCFWVCHEHQAVTLHWSRCYSGETGLEYNSNL